MSGVRKEIRIRRGYDLPIAGAAGDRLERGPAVRRVAVLGTDFPGVRPSLAVSEGDTVAIGDPVFADRKREAIRFCSPGNGRVTAIRRGRRRVLLAVVIELEDSATTRYVDVPGGAIEGMRPQAIREALLRHGLWPAFRTRPYGRIPDPDAEPHALFVTAIDTEPLSAEPAVLIEPRAESFRAGLRVLAQLHGGPLYVCTSPEFYIDLPDAACLQQVRFRGPHPAGLAGTHIHHLSPASEARPVWHIGYQDVVAIGRLFADRLIDIGTTIAVAGSALGRPGLIETRLGASLDALVRDRGLAADARVISGSPLSGREWTTDQPFLGRYHRQVSALMEAPAPARHPPRGTSGRSDAVRDLRARLPLRPAGDPAAALPGLERRRTRHRTRRPRARSRGSRAAERRLSGAIRLCRGLAGLRGRRAAGRRIMALWTPLLQRYGPRFGLLPPLAATRVTTRAPYVRDAMSVPAALLLVVVATLPAWAVGLWFTGTQIISAAGPELAAVIGPWRAAFVAAVPQAALPAAVGLAYFLPLLFVALAGNTPGPPPRAAR